MRQKIFLLSLFIMLGLLQAAPGSMQDVTGELAATLEVLSTGVEVRRVNTVNWISVKVEAIVGVGDVIRTNETGKARITFFADGVDTEIQPESEYRIDEFSGNDTSFTLSATALLGQSIQRIERLLDANSSYDIQTPSMELTVRGTEFAVRVEPNGRSATLVFEGIAAAEASGTQAAVSAGYGVRSTVDGALSDVVLASSFDQLDAALDGCSATVKTLDDVRLNVRIGPSRDFSRVATIDAAAIDKFMGISESGNWYRIDFRNHFGWVMASDVTLDVACAGLRVFPDTQVEDPTLYTELGEAIELDELEVPTGVPTPAADSESD